MAQFETFLVFMALYTATKLKRNPTNGLDMAETTFD
jgi:hypothetical protein